MAELELKGVSASFGRGALLDADGELVGIPAQIADSGVDANVGVAFAVPVVGGSLFTAWRAKVTADLPIPPVPPPPGGFA